MKELIFQESTASKDLISKTKKDKISKIKNRAEDFKVKEILCSENKENENNKITEAINTEDDNQIQASTINSNIKVEIEYLDEEIKELQNKLKTMIQSK